MQTLHALFPQAAIGLITKAESVTTTSDSAVELVPCDVHVTMSRRPLYLHGRYLKHVRGVSQSPWIVDGVRLGAYSVEELIANPILPKFGVRRRFSTPSVLSEVATSHFSPCF
jgi:tRNA U54 and U55 pseudouridine synthase Pus10